MINRIVQEGKVVFSGVRGGFGKWEIGLTSF
jgi:hypothetical protein